MAIESRLERLEKLLNNSKQDDSKLVIPEKWEDFCKLTTIRSGNQMVRFNPYPYQVKLIELMEQYPTVVVLKSRQLGITQAILSRFLHKALLNPAFSSVGFFKNSEDRGSNSQRIRQMALSIGAKYHIDNVSHQKFQGLGEIFLKNSSGEGSRGYDSISSLMFDEAAFLRNIESIYSASSASSAMLGDNVTKIILSTPSAKMGWFWDILNKDNDSDVEEICQAVVNQKLPPFYHWLDRNGTTCKVVIHYRSHPVYSQREDYLEYRQKIDNCSLEKIQREYNLTFINSEVSVFATDLIRNNATCRYEEKRDPDARYYIGIDPSYRGDNYCVAWVLKEIDGEYHSVNWYRQRRKTKDYNISKITDLIEQFKPQKIGIETNSGGQIYFEDLVKLNPGYEIISFNTNSNSKPVIIDRMILALERGQFRYPKNSPIYEEMLQFMRQGSKMGASEGAFDDCVMAGAIALSVTPLAIREITWSLKNVQRIQQY